MKALAWLVVLAFALAGCADDGGTDDDTDGGDTSPTGGADDGNTTGDGPEVSLAIAATGVYPIDFGYDQATLEAPAGATVTLSFSNEDTNPVTNHDWYLEALGAQTAVVAPGESDTITFTVDLEPGEYPFWCTIGNHRDQGMEGTFVVTEPAA